MDDEPALLETTAAILEAEYFVVRAKSGEEARTRLQSMTFDVVCTDYAMGGTMTGLDVLAFAATLPVFVGKILLTGTQSVGESAGFYVLLKPCDPERLLEVMGRAAAQAAAQRRAGRRASSLRGRAVAPPPEEPREERGTLGVDPARPRRA